MRAAAAEWPRTRVRPSSARTWRAAARSQSSRAGRCRDPSEAAIWASAAIAASWAPVKVGHPPGSCRHAAPGVGGCRLWVDDELIRSQVGTDVVDRVAEPRSGDHADDDRDEHAEADCPER